MAFPIAKVSVPADLRGATNGQLPDALLIAPGWPLRPQARLHRLAAAAFMALAQDIQAQFGETITAVSMHDAYRLYSVQESTFKSRYSPSPIAGRKTKTWNGKTYWQKPNTAMAGVPGTSNHGWGLAMDTALVRGGKVVGILANRQMFDWLLAHAADYGLSWEAQSEPWHLRYHAGDNIPARLCGAGGAAAPAAPVPAAPAGARPNLAEGSTGEHVSYLQGVIANKAGGNITVDGQFGPRTTVRVKDVQGFFGAAVDGTVGPQTWAIIDMLAGQP